MVDSTKECSRCLARKLIIDFHVDKRRSDGRYPWCKECRREYYGQKPFKARKFATKAEYDKDHRARLDIAERTERSRRSWMWTTYRLTPEDYDAMLSRQGGGCAICGGGPGPSTSRYGNDSGRFSVDHDHSCCPGHKACGKCVRGLLCGHCNRALGLMRDDPALLARAAEYVRETEHYDPRQAA